MEFYCIYFINFNGGTVDNRAIMDGRKKLKSLGDDFNYYADVNPCGMDIETMGIIADSVRKFLEFILTPILSREQAAQHLGVSTRTLDRLVEQGKIAKPKRRGFQKISFSRSDLDKFKGVD